MQIRHEEVQNNPRLPFYFFEKNSINVSEHWHLNLLGKKSAQNRHAYNELAQRLKTISALVQQKLTDQIRFKILSEFYMVIALLDEDFTAKEEKINQQNTPLIDQVILYINDHFSDYLNAEMIAAHFSTSQVTLNKQLKDSNGMTLGQYLNLVRLMHARQLLLSTNLSIDFIASDSGYSNARILNRNFKKWKGKTPTEYRNAFKQYFIS